MLYFIGSALSFYAAIRLAASLPDTENDLAKGGKFALACAFAVAAAYGFFAGLGSL